MSESEECEIIEPDSIFNNILSCNINFDFEEKITDNVEKLLEEKNKKIEELEEEILVIKKQEEKIKNVINYIVKDLHYINELQNVQPIYNSDGKIIETIVNEGWLDRRVPKTFDENGFWKTYELDGKIYEIKEKGVIIELKNN
jgi:hypothetical protein